MQIVEVLIEHSLRLAALQRENQEAGRGVVEGLYCTMWSYGRKTAASKSLFVDACCAGVYTSQCVVVYVCNSLFFIYYKGGA